MPADVRLTEVHFPAKGKITVGQADICFYKQGYSDKAIIHITDDQNIQISILIESFLTDTKIYDRYVEFES